MKLYYYHDANGNFGDDLNPWLWSRLIPDLLDESCEVLFVGIGTLLDRRIPIGPRKIVFGSGAGYGPAPLIDQSWNFYSVRGPLSASRLGLPEALAITDPAVLVRDFLAGAGADRHRVSFMPHHVSRLLLETQGYSMQAILETDGLKYIDPCREVDAVLLDIAASDLLITEAMHGAIVADALRVPWIPVQLLDHILDFKWQDWCSSLGLAYRPIRWLESAQPESPWSLPRFVRQVARQGQPTLSDPSVLEAASTRLRAQVDRLRRARECPCAGRAARPASATRAFSGGPPSPRGGDADESVGTAGATAQVEWLYQIHTAKREIAAVVPEGEALVLVDEDQWGSQQLVVQRRRCHFLERNGQYWGPPADDPTAIDELERLRRTGAGFIVFAWTAFWWLDYYAGFLAHLRSTYRCILANERLVVFDLRASA